MRVLSVLLFFCCFFTSSAQIFINEVCADNETIIADETGDFEDWIELYNAGNSAVNLQDYWLSDNEEEFTKWSFPNVTIPANGFLLVFASGKDFNGQVPHTNFKVSKSGEPLILLNPQLEIIDQIQSPNLEEDQSFGRQPDGTADFQFFYIPTPAASNNNSTTFNFAQGPSFENTLFFNPDATSITINCPDSNCQIYYTIDGSIPDENSNLYTGPFTIDTTTAIRAASVTPDLFLSAPVTRTFFINEIHKIPVIALTTSPENLWDWETGIFQAGPNADTLYPFLGANFWTDTEIPIYMEYFEEDLLKIEYPLGAQIHGGKGARTKKMKPLRLLAKESFGTSLMDYPFFKNRENTKFKRLVLRNSSGDFNICHMRDEFLARYFIDEGFDFEGIAEQPVVLYINGIYWGLMHLREKVDEHYLRYLFDVDPDNIDLLEEDTAVIEGNFDLFDAHESFVLNNDLSQTANFETAASYFDLQNLSDYMICQTFVNNTDWPHNNIKYWRPKTEGAKWRYILFDMDIAMALQGWSKASVNSFGNKMQRDEIRFIAIFKSFLENEQFRFDFINRYADLVNTSFHEETFTNEVIRSRDEVDHDMERHLPMWGKNHDGWYNNEMPKLLKFAGERPMYVRQFLMEYFELPTQDKITVRTFPESDAGTIQVNTVELDETQLPWEGIYFNASPIPISVSPKAGFTFSHWESNYSDSAISTDLTIRVNPRAGEVFTAVFNHEAQEPRLNLFPNPVSDILNINFISPGLESISINIYDAIGRQLIKSQQIATTGINDISLSTSQLNEGTFIIQIIGTDFSLSKKFVKLID